MRTAVLLAFASLTLIGASRPLNPLVPRVPNESATVAAECAEGAAPAPMPRIEMAEIPEPEPPIVAPPSAGLRTQLRDAQTALAGDDRPAFDGALARIRATLAGYPAGGEKSAAQNVVRVFEDAGMLWDAQFISPFFGEESAAYRAASAYPGWSEAIRRQILVDDRDRRFYPARESRQFLASVAAARLERLGVRTPAIATRPPAQEDDPNVPLPSVRPRRKPGKVETHVSAEPRPVTRRTTTAPRSSSSSSSSTSSPPSSSPAPSKPAPVRSSTPPAPVPERRPVVAPVAEATPPPVTETMPPPVPLDTAPIADPTAPLTGTGTTNGDTPIPDLATDTAPTSTIVTETTATDGTAEPAPAGRGRSLVLPLILILVGIGVLIVLFRASS